MIVLDSSVPWWKTEAMKAPNNDVLVWDVREQGAFISD